MDKLYKLKCDLKNKVKIYEITQKQTGGEGIKGIVIGLELAIASIDDMMSKENTKTCPDCGCPDFRPLEYDRDYDYECKCCGEKFN